MPWLYLLVALFGAWFTYNAFHPMTGTSNRGTFSFFAGWLTTELAVHHIAWQALATAAFVWAGALASWPGWLGLGVTLVSWAGLARCWLGARDAETVVESALRTGLGPAYRNDILREVSDKFAPGVDWRQLLLPFPFLHPEVERIRDVVYCDAGGARLKLDVYRPRSRPTGCPTLLQIHGGAWIVGSKKEQGLPLMLHLAARGWVCVSADYRLSPRATFPDHLIDLKQAIRWIREEGVAYGANPDFLVVTGGSAGGHLASLVALTANDPEYQPGFEAVDTSVRACVAFYGVYDFTDGNGDKVWPDNGFARFLERRVMKAARTAAPEAYTKASPIHRVREDAPPFFIIHGERDTLVPVAEARRFVTALRAVTSDALVYAEIPGAQHAFEIFPSLRTTFVIHGVERFLAYVYSRYAAQRGSNPLAAASGGD